MPNEQFKNALIESEKITGYLLNLSHPDGRGKALFFISHGFSLFKIEEIKNALIQQAIDGVIVREKKNRYGNKMVVIGNLLCPNGDKVIIITIWIHLYYERMVKFVTAYPFKK